MPLVQRVNWPRPQGLIVLVELELCCNFFNSGSSRPEIHMILHVVMVSCRLRCVTPDIIINPITEHNALRLTLTLN